MELNAQRVDAANAVVTSTITADVVEKNIDKMAKQASKSIDISGFRKGKVPVAVVKARHGEKLRQDAESDALRDLFEKALKELNIENGDVIGEPYITKFDKSENGNIDVELKFATKPAIELGDYKSFLPEVKDKRVTAKEIDERIETIASSSAPVVSVEEDRATVDGDFAVIDFEGFVDGVAFDGGKAEKYTLEIGSNSFIPGFEEQLVGMKKGEEKDITVTFPQSYQAKNLAGKESVFKIKLHEIKAKGAAVIDDEFAKKMLPGEEEANLDLLKEKIKEQIKAEKKAKYYNEELKPEYLEKLVTELNFALPSTVVDQEVDYAMNAKVRTLSEEDFEKLKGNKDEIEKLRSELEPDAINSVKATFIIDALAKAEGIEVSDNEVTQVIYYEALQTGRNPQEALKMYKENGYLPAIKMSMVEDKVITKLLDEKLGK